MASIVEIAAQQVTDSLQDLSVQNQDEKMMEKSSSTCTARERVGEGCENNITIHKDDNLQFHYGDCSICLNKIRIQETALVKGCEHAYCVTCILRWATYKKEPTCPQCKHPFEFLNIHRSLDGSIHDYMFEESVCLLLRASWFKPLIVEERDEVDDDMEYFYNEDPDEVYLGSSSRLRIGNRRWGDNGYVRSGRQEARPVYRPSDEDTAVAGPSHQPRKKEPAKETVGRRAKRALKREAADQAAAAKHQQHLARLGRK